MRVDGVRQRINWALASFLALAARESIFAASEISKGLVILGAGDMATADEVGELVVIVAQVAIVYARPSLTGLSRANEIFVFHRRRDLVI